MPKIVNFFKCICRYFCGQSFAAQGFSQLCFQRRNSAFWLIDNEILGPGYDRGFGRYILFDILLLYHKCVFLVFCSYLLFRAYFRAGSNLSGWCSLFLYRQAAFTAILTPIQTAKKKEYSPAFIASLVAICIYVLVATFAPNSFLMILYAIFIRLASAHRHGRCFTGNFRYPLSACLGILF